MSKKGKIALITGIVIVLGGVAFILYTLFSHSSDVHLRLIPKNAAAVMKIDIKQLALKADPIKLMQNPVFKNVPENGKSSIRKLVADPFSTGIDPLENIYGFLAKDGEATISAIVFKVSDQSKLETFERGLGMDGGLEVESGIYYSEIDENRCIAWNSEAGIILAINGGDKKILANKYLKQDKSQSILANETYGTFSRKTFDLGLYLDNKNLSQMSGTGSTLSSLGFTDGHGEVLLNFENDKIETVYSNYPETKVAATTLKKTGPDSKHFEAAFPQTPLLYLNLSADINAIFNAANADPTMKDNISDMENYVGLKDSEIRKLFTGDISLAFTDYKDISTYDPRVSANIARMVNEMNGTDEDKKQFALNVPMAYVNVGITNEDQANKILSEMGMQKTGDFYVMPGFSYVIYAAAKNGHLVITNDYYAAETISKNGKFSSTLPTNISKTNPFVLWADLDQKHFPPALITSMQDTYDEPAVNFFLKAIKPFQHIEMESQEMGSRLDIEIEPGEGNSLYRLIIYYGSLAN